jgi:hypothetical protein
MTIRTAALLTALGTATAAIAGPTFVAFGNNTMYRFGASGPIDTFTLSDKMMSLSTRPDGAIVGHSAERNTGQMWESYELVGANTNSPSLSMLSDQVAGPRPTLSFADGNAYSSRDGGGFAELITVDSGTLIDNGLIGPLNIQDGVNGSGYDAVNDVLYGINRDQDVLVTISRNTGNATPVGSLGIDFFNGGAEFYNGTLYAFVQDLGSQTLVFGSIHTGTGAFTAIRTIDTYDANDTTFMSLALVPAPASLGLLAMGGLVASRRRR